MLREQSVTLGVDFLSHPNVVSHSREDKTSFLRGKGLTGEEIDEAFKRVEPQAQQAQQAQAPPQGHAAPAPPAYYPPAPAPVQEESWGAFLLNSLIPASLAVSSTASLLYFYKNHVLHDNGLPPPPLLPGAAGMLQPPPFMPEPPVVQPNPVVAAPPPWRPQPLAPVPTAADFLEATAPPSPAPPTPSNSDSQLLRDTLEALKETVGLLKQQQQQSSPPPQGDLQASLPIILQAMQSSSEVKAELSAIKSLLLASLVRGGGSSAATTTTDTDLIQSLLQPVAAAAAATTTEPLVVDDTVAATPDPSASASVSPSPTPSSDKEEAADRQIEERLTKAREALAEMVASCDKLEAEVTNSGYGMVVMFLKNLLKDSMNPRYRRIAKGNANYSKLLQPLVGHQKFLEAVGFDERGASSFEFCNDWTQNLQEQANGFARQVLASTVANLESIREQSRAAPAAAASTAAPSSETPSYPMSFEEIIRLQKEGKRPEGIKDIPNDRLSQDAPSKPVLQQPVKPWELSKPKVSIQQVPDEVEEDS